MRRTAGLTLGLLLAAAVGWACAPGGPLFLLGNDLLVLGGPTAEWPRAVLKLAPEGTRFREPAAAPWLETAKADRADLEKALAGLGTPPERRNEILARHESLRQALMANASRLNGPAEPAPGLLGGAELPAGLPPEFADYLAGALAYHERRFPDAAAIWERLLARPADERRFRSTWAAFMLGKVHLRGDRDRAVDWFRKTRELAGQGFHDSLGLAAASVGWEARAERDRGHYDRALALYVRQLSGGDLTARTSIRLAGRSALNAGPEALQAVARDPAARAAMTELVLAPPVPEGLLAGSDEDAAAWLRAVTDAGIEEVPGADRLAWAAYLAGDFEATTRWLERSPADAPMTSWLRAKLRLRDGRLDEAAALLAETVRRLPPSPEPRSYLPFAATRERAMAEEGAVRLARGEYGPALDLFLRGGSWIETAYLAEQVLTPEELQSWVDKTWPAAKLAGFREDEVLLFGDPGTARPQETALRVRYLLGRRLARAGRLDAARAYLPESLRARMTSLASDLARGRDAARPRRERSDALFRAACLTRGSGLELAGTEIEPDWAYTEGSASPGSMADLRQYNVLLAPTPDELARVARHRTVPARRYHYRYRAADLAWEAARLLPSGDRKAGILATAGNWLRNRDPEAADRFYKQLVRCCRSTDLGREADALRWFPQADACPMEKDPS